MEQNFSPLESDDILLFEDNTYIVWKFKELMSQEINGKFDTSLNPNTSRVLGLFKHIHCDNRIFLITKNMTWHSCLKCKILKVGSTGWQSGELCIKADVTFYETKENNRSITRLKTEILLDFCCDQTIEYKSPLDDFRENIKA